MKTVFSLALLTALTSASAFAIDGRYEGDGVLEIEGRPTERCERVSLDMSEDSWSVYIRRFEFDCGETHASMDPRRFDVRGRDIYFEGQRVGTREPGATTITIREPGTGVTLGLNFREQYYDTVDVVQELAAPTFNQRMTASLRRF